MTEKSRIKDLSEALRQKRQRQLALEAFSKLAGETGIIENQFRVLMEWEPDYIEYSKKLPGRYSAKNQQNDQTDFLDHEIKRYKDSRDLGAHFRDSLKESEIDANVDELVFFHCETSDMAVETTLQTLVQFAPEILFFMWNASQKAPNSTIIVLPKHSDWAFLVNTSIKNQTFEMI